MNGDFNPSSPPLKSQANARHCWMTEEEDRLTELGKAQADDLGERWADVHIDFIYTSPFTRAKDTALALAKHNKAHPQVIESIKLKEQNLGPVVGRLMNARQYEEAFFQRTGQAKSSFKLELGLHRNHCPPDGESLEEVTARGISAILEIINTHGVELATPPEEMSLRSRTLPREQLVNGLPHIVIVSHNTFLAELYEGILSWNKPKHEEGYNHYNNTSWSRHILRVKALDGEEDIEGCYQKKYGIDLQNKDMREPPDPFIDY